ncbi:hypothetical protein ACO0LO_01990 [Undibacterium sp. TJN25]|uniref:hypothetical protein n=1 Tax=Undibacterium sp. TJN25 TaxID=3413056 RepID=UPI003BF0B383
MMKRLLLIAIFGALPMTLAAQTATDANTVMISNGNVQNSAYKMLPREFAEFKGLYGLSNGKTLFLFSRQGTRMYANVKDQPAHEIIATGPNTFVALDRQLKMTINRHANGDVSGELLMRASSQPVARGEWVADEYTAIALH